MRADLRNRAKALPVGVQSHMKKLNWISYDICDLSSDEMRSLPLVGRVGRVEDDA